MGALKVTLIKDWTHPTSKTVKKKGAVLEVSIGLKEDLEKGGFIEGPKKEKKESLTKKDK